MSDHVMMDASIILSRHHLDHLRKTVPDIYDEQFFVSDAFVRLIESTEASPETEDAVFQMLSQFFEIRPEHIDREAIREFLRSNAFANNGVRYVRDGSSEHETYQGLLRLTGNEWITQILFEEWEFLTTRSWLVAAVYRPFGNFIEAGGHALLVSKTKLESLLDSAAAKVLKKPAGAPLSGRDKLRAIGKWVAVGGSAAAGLVTPLVGAAVALAAGIFLLYDP